MSRVHVAVPAMRDRSALRTVTAPIRDVPGVVSIEVDLESALVVVEGSMTPGQVREAIESVGYGVEAVV